LQQGNAADVLGFIREQSQSRETLTASRQRTRACPGWEQFPGPDYAKSVSLQEQLDLSKKLVLDIGQTWSLWPAGQFLRADEAIE
jgi:hypothetical protein